MKAMWKLPSAQSNGITDIKDFYYKLETQKSNYDMDRDLMLIVLLFYDALKAPSAMSRTDDFKLFVVFL